MATNTLLHCLLGCAIAVALAAALGGLLRACGVRGAWIAAGVCVGALLGGDALGRVQPAWHDQFFAGAMDARRQAFVAEREIEIANLAALSSGALVDVDDLSKLESTLRAAQERVREATMKFNQPAVWITAMLAAFVMIGASPLIERIVWWRHGGLAVGLLYMLVPASVIIATLTLSDRPEPDAWWMYAIGILCIGAASMQQRDRWVASRMLGDFASTLDAARGAAGVIACVLALVAGLCAAEHDAAWLLPWGAMLAAWGLATEPPRSLKRLVGPAVAGVVAIAITRIDLQVDWKSWIVLGIFVAAEDMRWLGAGTGLSLWTRIAWKPCLRAAMPLADASLAQAALGSVAYLSNLIPAWIALAILISAAAVELLEPLRRRTALGLDQAIQQSSDV